MTADCRASVPPMMATRPEIGSDLDTLAMFVRHNAVMRLLRIDPTLTPEEALLYVVAPNEAMLRASIEQAEAERDAKINRALAVEPDVLCPRCYGETDADRFCPTCGKVAPRRRRVKVLLATSA